MAWFWDVFNIGLIIILPVGALLAGLLFGGGASIINAALHMMRIFCSLLGAIILLAVVSLVRGGTV